jgi:hypothetical protein
MQCGKPNDSANDMTTDDIHRLREWRIRIAEHQHARRPEGAQQQQHTETAAQKRERPYR